MKRLLSEGLKVVQSRSICHSFEIPEDLISSYRLKKPNFGFNGLGEVVFFRTYSRIKDDGKNETYCDCLKRVVEGTYSIQKDWMLEKNLEWDEESAISESLVMYDKMFNFKMLPSGRGLFAMGTSIVEHKGAQPLNSCAFVSTSDILDNPSIPFEFLMDSSMLGVGVGFDTKGGDLLTIKGPDYSKEIVTLSIEDSREGWVESTTLLLESYFLHSNPIQFDYSLIRKAGEELIVFGGISAGPFPLMYLHNTLRTMLDKLQNKKLQARHIVDIMNCIGKCVISGNIQRIGEIAFGEAYDTDFMDLKNYTVFPDREDYGWASNNSIFGEIGMDYSEVVKRIFYNGEPGIAWLENMKAYGRLKESEKNYDDHLVMGANPCMEQSLESFEVCNLVETFPNHHSSIHEYLETLEIAFNYAKTVTLLEIKKWEKTNEIINRNRRIGCSMSGIAQFLSSHSLSELKEWCEEGYMHLKNVDKKLSKKLEVNESIKITSIKPSGTISLVAGATPGIHFPESEYYIRRLRISKNSNIIPYLYESGYKIDEDVTNNNSWVIEFPIHIQTTTKKNKNNIRSNKDVSMWEKLNLAAFVQEHWSDNQVSCTVSYDPEETTFEDIESALQFYQYKLKGVCFFPQKKETEEMYSQMPYEKITEEKYKELIKNIKILDLRGKLTNEEAMGESGCSNDSCSI